MKRVFITLFATVSILCCQFQPAQAQKFEERQLRIGSKFISLKSPFSARNWENAVAEESGYQNAGNVVYIHVKQPAKHRVEMFYGFGFALPKENNIGDYYPISTGRSFHLNIGWRHYYRISYGLSLGTMFQYSGYTFHLKNQTRDFMDYTPKGDIYREYFRTDNIGTGFLQLIRIAPRLHIETGVYGDFAYSKRYKVKSRVDGKKENTKFRDGTRFNQFQAGAQMGLRWYGTTFYARYRFTNMLNATTMPAELPRWSLGVNFVM